MDTHKLKSKIIQLINDIELSNDKNKTFRITAYKKVINVIDEKYKDKDIITVAKIKKLKITSRMKTKLSELIQDKKPIKKSDKYKLDKDLLLLQLSTFLTIGTKKANELIAHGLTHCNQIRQKKYYNMLNKNTQLILNYKPVNKISYDIIKEIEDKLLTIETKDMEIHIVGSYKRGQLESKDIDILVISDGDNVIEHILGHFRKLFEVAEYYSKGKDKMSLIIKYKDNMYKVDVFQATFEDKIPMLMYTIGSKKENIRLRRTARKIKVDADGNLDDAGKYRLKLNQKGLFIVEYTTTNWTPKKIPLATDKDYYKKLNLDYKEPNKR